MGCQCDRKDKRLEVILSFKREELFYDISNAAWIEGDGLSDDMAVQRQRVRDILEKGNLDFTLRELGTAHAEMREMLYPYTKRRIPTDRTAVPWSDPLNDPNVYMIALSLPDTFSVTTVRLMEREIHDFLVARALAAWLRITLPEAAQKWAEKAEAAAERVNQALHDRMTPRRLTPHGIY